MKHPTDKNAQNQAQGKSRAELDIGYAAYLSSMEDDYRTIKDGNFFTEQKREIGYHAHMPKAKKKN